MTLPAINAPLDELVAPLVEALRRDGFATFSSCDGRGGDPWVNVTALDRRDAQIQQTALVQWCEERGLTAAVGAFYGTVPEGDGVHVERNVWVRLEVYDAEALRGATL